MNPSTVKVFKPYELEPLAERPLPIVASDRGATLKSGEFTSPNYVPGRKGWKMDSDGNAEFESIVVRSPRIAVFEPHPVSIVTAAGNLQLNVNTDMYLAAVYAFYAIEVARLSFRVGNIGTAGTVDIALFTADGSQRKFNVTSGNIAAANTVYTIDFDEAVLINQGVYYLGIHPNGTTDVTVNALNAQSVNLNVVGESVLSGSLVIVASTTPTSFDPTALTSGINIPWVRFFDS